MTRVVQQIVLEYKKALQEIYGKSLAELILFGSYARGDHHKESDIDLAVVFQDSHVRTSKDKKITADLDSHFSLKYGLMLSSFITTYHKKQTSNQGLYQEIRKQGIRI